MSTFIPKLGDLVEFDRFNDKYDDAKTTIVGTVIHVPMGQEVWFRIRAASGATFEAKCTELRAHVPCRDHPIEGVPDNVIAATSRANARDFVGLGSVEDVCAWKHCGMDGCVYCDEVARLRAVRFPDNGPTHEECVSKFEKSKLLEITESYVSDDVCWRCGKSIRDGMAGIEDHVEGCPGRAMYKVDPRHMMTESLRHTASWVDTDAFNKAARTLRASSSALEFLGDVLPSGVRFDSETPDRMARAFAELVGGYETTDFKALLKTFARGDADSGIVIVRDIPFASVCEHHVLPFTGTATVAYLPSDRIVGLSKIPRLVDAVTRRLQVQERIGAQIADALVEHVGARGVFVVLKSKHTCMTLRGARCPGEMVTSTIRGVFENEPSARAEVLSLMGL